MQLYVPDISLLVWVESVGSSIIYELDTKTPKEKLPVVPVGDTATIPYYSLATAFSGVCDSNRMGVGDGCQM